MKCNVVPLDAGIRSAVGMALLASPLLNFHTYPYSLLGIVPLATGVAGYCPLYSLFRALVPSGTKRGHGVGPHAASHA